MNAIGEKDVERFRRRIDPEESACESRVAVRSDRKHLAARLGVARVDVETARPFHGNIRRGLHTSQYVDYLRPEDWRAAAQQHPAVLRQIVNGDEESRVARHPAHPPRGGIVNHAAEHDLWSGGL